MILDTLENYQRYVALNERIAKGFDYLRQTDLANLAVGKHEIEGESLFAIVQEYTTKVLDDCVLEGHKRYIDIQYIVLGEEFMGISNQTDLPIIEENESLDYTFYDGDVSFVLVQKGMFAVFFPGDLHQTCIQTHAMADVKKVVIKVLV